MGRCFSCDRQHYGRTASDATRVEGESNPEFNASFDGFIGGDDQSVLNGPLGFSTTADASSTAGTYAITASGVTASNYGQLVTTSSTERPGLQAPADSTNALEEPPARSIVVEGGISLPTTSMISQPTTVRAGAPSAKPHEIQATTAGDGWISAKPLEAMQLSGAHEMMFQLPEETFRHSNTQEQITLSAQVVGGGALPDSLHFDPSTGILSGTLPANHPGLVIVFMARDAEGSEASTRLEIRP